MAKFLSYFNISRINDSKDFLGVSPDSTEGNIVVTLSCNIVIVVKICSQQQIISWSTQEKLSSKVIFDNSSKRYVGVFGNRFIRCWDATTTDINSIKKIKLQKPVLYTIASETDVIILYTDGSVDKLSEALSARKELPTATQYFPDNLQLKYSNVKDIAVKYLTNGTQILTYFLKVGNDDMNLVILPLFCDAKQKTLKITRKDVTVNLCGYAIIDGDTSLMLLTIWSDHRLFLLNLDEKIESEKLPGNFVSILSTLKVDTPLTIMGVAKNCVAIYGANSNQEGASLLLYNTQFKVVKAQQYFKVYFDCSRIWIVDDNIILAMGQNLAVVSFRMTQELLVDLLGTYNTDNHIAIEGDLINEEYNIQSLCSFKAADQPKKFKNIENAWNKLGLACEGEKLNKSTWSMEQNQTLINVDCEKSFVDDIITLIKMPSAKHLLNKTILEFYIRQLDNCGSTEQEISEKLLTMLTKTKNCSNIVDIMSRFTCPTEYIIAKAFYSIVMNNLSNSALKGGDNSSANILENFIITTAFQPIRKMTLIENLRNYASSPQLLNVINFLYSLLTDDEPPNNKTPLPSQTCNSTLEMQIFYWFDVLVNAHFQQLVLSKDIEVLNMLLKWMNLIQTYKKQINALQALLTQIFNVVQKDGSSQRPNSYMWYCIEDLGF